MGYDCECSGILLVYTVNNLFQPSHLVRAFLFFVRLDGGEVDGLGGRFTIAVVSVQLKGSVMAYPAGAGLVSFW